MIENNITFLDKRKRTTDFINKIIIDKTEQSEKLRKQLETSNSVKGIYSSVIKELLRKPEASKAIKEFLKSHEVPEGLKELFCQ